MDIPNHSYTFFIRAFQSLPPPTSCLLPNKFDRTAPFVSILKHCLSDSSFLVCRSQSSIRACHYPTTTTYYNVIPTCLLRKRFFSRTKSTFYCNFHILHPLRNNSSRILQNIRQGASSTSVFIHLYPCRSCRHRYQHRDHFPRVQAPYFSGCHCRCGVCINPWTCFLPPRCLHGSFRVYDYHLLTRFPRAIQRFLLRNYRKTLLRGHACK